MVVLRNNTQDWLEIKKGVPITWMVAANEVPKVTNLFSTEQTKEQSTLTEMERQDLLLEKLDLSGLESRWGCPLFNVQHEFWILAGPYGRGIQAVYCLHSRQYGSVRVQKYAVWAV